jgi:hypothetical protein
MLECANRFWLRRRVSRVLLNLRGCVRSGGVTARTERSANCRATAKASVSASSGVKLSVNLITGGKYYRAGDDIPAGDLPDFAAKYAMADDGNGGVSSGTVVPEAPAEASPRAPTSAAKRYVRRGTAFKSSGSEEVIPGERIYERRGWPPRFVRYGRVPAEVGSL